MSEEDKHQIIDIIIRYIEDKPLNDTELAMLKQNEAIYQQYASSEEFLHHLKGLFYYLSNPDHKYHLQGESLSATAPGIQGIFSESIPLKELINQAIKITKNKFKETYKHIKINKGIIPQIKPTDKKKFTIELEEKQFTKLALNRKKILETRKKAISNPKNNPIISWTSHNYYNRPFDIYQSIKYAISNGSFSNNPLRIKVSKEYFQYPIFSFKQNYNIMLVLDVSNSVQWIMPYMEKIILMVTKQAKVSKDKLGLIVFKNDKANIVHYPTNNIHQIIGSINHSFLGGLTPLADGINKAKQVLENSRYQTVGMANAIILVSDCFPEPISGKYHNLIDEPVCQEFLHSCEKLVEKNIKLLIISPVISNNNHFDNSLGYRLGKQAADKARGKYINLSGKMSFGGFSNELAVALDEHSLETINKQLNDFIIY